MSFNSDNLKDYLYAYKRSVEKDMSEEEKKIIDRYIESTSETMNKVLQLIENVSEDEDVLSRLKEEADKFMKDEKWLEKLLRTSSHQ